MDGSIDDNSDDMMGGTIGGNSDDISNEMN